MNVMSLIKGAVKGAKANLPAICTGVAVVGTWATAVSSGACTLKAQKHLERVMVQLIIFQRLLLVESPLLLRSMELKSGMIKTLHWRV